MCLTILRLGSLDIHGIKSHEVLKVRKSSRHQRESVAENVHICLFVFSVCSQISYTEESV